MANFNANILIQEDLINFHSKHFTVFGCSQESPEYNDKDDGDDLGYYPDGNKRTLTDEQIAIFRHSEIQELLKIHQAAIDDGLPSPFAALGFAVVDETVAQTPSLGHDPESVNAGIQTTSSSRAEESQPLRKSSQIPAPSASGKNKRKRKRYAKGSEDIRHNPQKYTAEGEERTFRRIAREMDSQKDSAVDLDY